jgi:uncharacterized protein GlcG (DUF336 family)
MKSGRRILVSIALALLGTASAHAQAVLVEKNVSMKMSQMIIEGVVEDCAKTGYKVTVVIVDNAGVVRASLRGDGTAPHTMEFARKKAYTARSRNQTSLEFNVGVSGAPGGDKDEVCALAGIAKVADQLK